MPSPKDESKPTVSKAGCEGKKGTDLGAWGHGSTAKGGDYGSKGK